MQHTRVAELRGVKWDDISSIAAIAQAPSLRQAAREAAVTPSTLVRQIQRLEAQLGTQIFERRSRGMALTEAGQVILKIAEEMEWQFMKLREVANLDGKRQGLVKIAAPELLVSLWLGARLNDFVAENRSFTLALEHLDKRADEACDDADLVISFVKPQNPDLVAARICTIHLHPFASADFIERNGLPDGVRRGKTMFTVKASDKFLRQSELDAVIQRQGAETREALVTGSTLSQIEAMEKGLALGELPNFIVATGGRLVPLEFGHKRSIPVWLCYRQQVRRVERVAAVISWLKQVFDEKRYPWFRADPMHPAEIMQIIGHAMGGQKFMPRWATEHLSRPGLPPLPPRALRPPPKAASRAKAAPHAKTARPANVALVPTPSP
jgi:DNA-binding transcriptional LysR family regulator